MQRLHFGSWNVEGLTDIKLEQLCSIMRTRALGLLCLQETRVSYSGSRILDNGYIVITAAQDDEKKTYAGVGFLLAPWMKKSVFSFKPISERICCIKLRVRGGKAAIFNTYAPHGGYEYAVRQRFFTDLAGNVADTSSYGLKLVVGDFNARIHNDRGGENQVFGRHCYGKRDYNPDQHANANRELLLELRMRGQGT